MSQRNIAKPKGILWARTANKFAYEAVRNEEGTTNRSVAGHVLCYPDGKWYGVIGNEVALRSIDTADQAMQAMTRLLMKREKEDKPKRKKVSKKGRLFE